MHAQARIGENFHQEPLVLDWQGGTADFNILQLFSKAGNAPSAQPLNVLPNRWHHAKTCHMPGIEYREKRLKVSEIANQYQCSSSHKHATQASKAKRMAQRQR